jgi:hypothetical protein
MAVHADLTVGGGQESVDAAGVVQKLLTAIEAGDLESVRRIYHPEAIIWHSHDGVSQSVEENLATLAWITRHLPGIRYVHVRRYCFAGGVVDQHDTEVRAPGRDQPLRIATCMVVLVNELGQVTRLDEYIDSAAVVDLTAAARPRGR